MSILSIRRFTLGSAILTSCLVFCSTNCSLQEGFVSSEGELGTQLFLVNAPTASQVFAIARNGRGSTRSYDVIMFSQCGKNVWVSDAVFEQEALSNGGLRFQCKFDSMDHWCMLDAIQTKSELSLDTFQYDFVTSRHWEVRSEFDDVRGLDAVDFVVRDPRFVGSDVIAECIRTVGVVSPTVYRLQRVGPDEFRGRTFVWSATSFTADLLISVSITDTNGTYDLAIVLKDGEFLLSSAIRATILFRTPLPLL